MSIKIGTPIFYTGDRANLPGEGVVVSFNGALAKVELEDGRVFMPYMFDIGQKYEGHCNPRFVTKAAKEAFYAERIAAARKQYEAMGF